jgi:hypothetical protein
LQNTKTGNMEKVCIRLPTYCCWMNMRSVAFISCWSSLLFDLDLFSSFFITRAHSWFMLMLRTINFESTIDRICRMIFILFYFQHSILFLLIHYYYFLSYIFRFTDSTSSLRIFIGMGSFYTSRHTLVWSTSCNQGMPRTRLPWRTSFVCTLSSCKPSTKIDHSN